MVELLNKLKNDAELSDDEKKALMSQWINEIDVALFKGVTHSDDLKKMVHNKKLITEAIEGINTSNDPHHLERNNQRTIDEN